VQDDRSSSCISCPIASIATIFIGLAEVEDCVNNADWCPSLFPGQCYDQMVEERCCKFCRERLLFDPSKWQRLFFLLSRSSWWYLQRVNNLGRNGLW